MLHIVSNIPGRKFLITGGDLNYQVDTGSDGFEGIHGEHVYSTNDERIRIIDLYVTTDLNTSSIFFEKQTSSLQIQC